MPPKSLAAISRGKITPTKENQPVKTIRFALAAMFAIAFAGCHGSTSVKVEQPALLSSASASPLDMLKAGNARFVVGQPIHANQSVDRRMEVAGGQRPFAIIVGCSDSRVPPEIVFDQGLGDLFVVRVAGNILDDHALGSIEYAAEHLHVPLVVVLGHDKCGAVQAAVSGGDAPGHIGSLVEAIEPAVEDAKSEQGDLLDNAIDANVRRVVTEIRHSEPILEHEVEAGKLTVVGARYKLDSGEVVFFPW
jgi:carbonic anhydrase